MTKKILAALLAVMMIVSMLPATFAVNAAGCPGQGEDHSLKNCPDAVKGDLIEPGCCTPGYQQYKCNVCGDWFAVDVKPSTTEDDCTWKLVSEYVAPNCTEAGAWAKYVCEKNENTVKLTDADGNAVAADAEAPAALGHEYEGDCKSKAECKVCGYVNTDGKHSWEKAFNRDEIFEIKDPTEQTNGQFCYKCSDCGALSPWFEIIADGHKDSNMTLIPGTTPTCESAGTREHYICNNASCEGKLFIKYGENDYREVTEAQLAIDALPHTFIEDPTHPDYAAFVVYKKPTCKTNGYTLEKCTVCEQWIKDDETITPAGEEYHEWTVLEEAVVGTCTQEGKRAKKQCDVCKIVVGGEVIEGTGKGHAVVTVTFDGDCMHEAYEFTYCTNSFCDAAVKTSLTLGATTVDLTKIAEGGVKILTETFGAINADVHTFGWVTTEVATCKAGGHKVWMCTACEEESTVGKDANHTGPDHMAIPADPVNNHVWEVFTPANCTDKAVYKCGLCDETEARGEANGHDYEGQTAITVHGHCDSLAGTGVDGYTYKLCKVCSEPSEKTYSDDLKYELDYIYEDIDLAKAQHKLSDNLVPTIYREGSCEVEGLWTLGDCEDCKRTVLLVDSETGGGHTMKDGTYLAPTCTTIGGYECANSFCNLENNWYAMPALGHNLTKVEGKPADCENDGQMEHYKCSNTCCSTVFYVAASDCTIAADKLSITMPSINLLPEMWVNKAPVVVATADADDATKMILTIGENVVDGTFTLVTANTEYTFIIKDGKFEAVLTETHNVKIDKFVHGSALGSLGFGSNVNSFTSDYCTDFTYENLQWCATCGYSVMYGYKAAQEHDFTDAEKIFVDCEENYKQQCKHEGCIAEQEVADSAPGHKNSDGRYFFSDCADTETNRHCVVCCADPENCTGVAGDCLIANDHNLFVKLHAEPTCKEYGYTLYVCENIINGEKCPYEQIRDLVEPLDYHDYIWETDYVDGVKKGVCRWCGEEATQNSVGFELVVDNFNAPGAGYTQSSLIEVTVNLYATEPNTALRGFNFCLKTEGVMFVEAKYNTGCEFDIGAVTLPENAKNDTNGIITVNGMASNDRFTDKQNVIVNGEIAVVKLYFRVLNVDAVSFTLPGYLTGGSESESAWVYSYNEETGNIEKDNGLFGDSYEADVKEYMDITCDGATTMTDVLEAYEMISNPEEGETPYNVVMDINKDGVVDVAELEEIMNFLAGNYDLEEMLKWNVPESHMALIGSFVN